MSELVHWNRYLHDFTSAMWVCGSILVWMVWRESQRDGVSAETVAVLERLGAKLHYLTGPALLITLASGGIRALTFAKYEHVGEITTSIVVGLVIKHILFTVFVAWGVWVHWKSRSSAQPVGDRP